MSRFLLAWELGGGLGHSTPLSQVAAPLIEQGHEVHFVLRDLSTVHTVFGAMASHERVHFWQAPLWQSQLRGVPESATYAELLFRAGFLDTQRLGGLVRAWRTLFDAVRPALLLADHAPTAMLAARGLPFRRALMGTGFFLPLQRQPIPPFREWEPIPPARVQAAEARALQTCNEILSLLGEPPLRALHELLAADERFLLTWPEVDHYAARASEPGAVYWGALPGPAAGAAAPWPPGEGHRLFAYLKADHAPTEAALRLLGAGPWRTLAYVPGLSAALREQLASPHLALSAEPVSMARVGEAADAVLCNAGSGTVCTALQAGKPVVMLPMHAEQLLFARRVQEAGAGAYLMEADVPGHLADRLRRVLQEATFHEAARRFAVRYGAPARPFGDVAQRVAARCVALAGAAP
ncbi:nucleotide disphospho-sugar-binding domain-containing protein [Aquincola sp. MAHUQ-54]|uniref:Nucleotide disphospho-sugar-binding domain-containing protein n=1 Tax=Aquincola agrisoli TaxID=3119538 RepID=A0AAW9QKV5_9BURK